MFRQKRPLGAQPAFQVFDQRRRLALASGEAGGRILAPWLAIKASQPERI